MMRAGVLISFLCSLALVGLCGESGRGAAVEELTQGTFDAAAAAARTGGEKLLVEFYAPWCVHCREFAAEYERVAATLAAQKAAVRVARVDGHRYRALSWRFEVRGFPSFFLLDGPAVLAFEGRRSAEALVTFALDGTGGKPLPAGWKAPRGLYWSTVSRLLGGWERALTWVEKNNFPKSTLWFGAMGSLAIVLVLFLLFINFLTKPKVERRKTE